MLWTCAKNSPRSIAKMEKSWIFLVRGERGGLRTRQHTVWNFKFSPALRSKIWSSNSESSNSEYVVDIRTVGVVQA
jgi:hypothetical protein